MPQFERLIHIPSGAVIARIVKLSGFWEKGRGVIARPIPGAGEGFWLPGVASVHTFFVSGPLDLLFLDAQFATLAVHRRVSPWRPYIGARGAHHVIELGAGTLKSDSPTGERWAIQADRPTDGDRGCALSS